MLQKKYNTRWLRLHPLKPFRSTCFALLDSMKSHLPGHTVSGTVLCAVVVQLVASNVLSGRLAVVQQVSLVLHCAVGALIPLLVAGVALLVRGASLLSRSSVIDIGPLLIDTNTGSVKISNDASGHGGNEQRDRCLHVCLRDRLIVVQKW